MSQVEKYVLEHWPWGGRIAGHRRAAWPAVLLRLGYLVSIGALMVVVLTFGGADWRPQAGAGGGPGLTLPAGAVTHPPAGNQPGMALAPVALVAPAGEQGSGATGSTGQTSHGEQGDKAAGGVTSPEGQPATEPQLPVQPLRQVAGAGHRVALTFDDGPFPAWTGRYLAVLAATKTPATFFMVGQQAQAHPELVKSVVDGGHEVASHSWRHANLGKVPRAAAEADLGLAAAALEQITGQPVHYFRPPYGALGPDLLAAAAKTGARTVTWSVDPRDWSNPGPRAVVQRVMANVRDGSIILLHEAHPGTLVALPLLIKELRDKGYELVTVSQLIAAPKAQ